MKLVSLFSFIATVQSFSSYSSIQLPNYEERGDEILHIQPNDLLVVDLLRRLTSTLLFPWQMRHFFCVGDCVTLVTGYQQYHDAIHGPLKPGDEGVMISCDIHSGVIRALVLVSGRTWYYDKRALRRASANRSHEKHDEHARGDGFKCRRSPGKSASESCRVDQRSSSSWCCCRCCCARSGLSRCGRVHVRRSSCGRLSSFWCSWCCCRCDHSFRRGWDYRVFL